VSAETPADGGAADQRRRQLAEALRARRAAPAPLAPNQERLFALQELDPSSTAYAEAVVLRLRGAVDAEALVCALHGLRSRHEWLRSRIEVDGSGPVQVVDDALALVVERADLPAAAGRGLGPEAVAWVRGVAEEPLRLREGPVWRAGLARLSAQDHLLVLVVHHVACDASSIAVLLDELGVRYDAAADGGRVALETPRSPRDLARAVRALQTSEGARAAVARHAAALAGADLDARAGGLDADPRPGPARASVRRVPAVVARRVARVSSDLGTTPFAAVCVAIGAAVADATGAGSPVLGVPVDLRWHLPDSEETVSFLVETAAVAMPDLLGRTFQDAVVAVRDAIGGALAQPPPFEDVVAALRASGDLPPTGAPLHAYATWLDGEEDSTLGRTGPSVSHVDLPLGEAKADLSWTVVSRPSGLELRLEHDSARVGEVAARRLLDAVVRLLDTATADVGAPLGTLPLLPAADLDQLRQWEGQAGPVPQEDLLAHVARGLAGSSGPVLVTEEEEVTGADLLSRVDGLAAALVAAGVRPGDRVAVPSRRVAGTVVALLAVLRAGATYLPLDVGHPAQRQAGLARSVRVVAVVGERSWAQALAATSGARAVVTDAAGRPEVAAPAPAAWPARSPADLAYVMHTSGSTGRPKAVRVPDSAVVARALSYRELLADAGVRHLLQSTLTFDASVYLFWVLATGGVLVLPADDRAADPLALARLAERHGTTDAFFVPGLYEAVLRAAPSGALRSLRRVCVGGDVVPPPLVALHHATVPDAELLDVYGPTEVVVTSTAARVELQDAEGRSVPIGRPHAGTLARVLDRHRRRLPVGLAGELHLGGPCVADGYDGAEEADPGGTPFWTGREPDGTRVRWYATGDLVRWREDGQLEYLGRRDRQVKLRGQRVELGEVEAALRRAAGVEEAAVEVVGSGAGRRLVGFVAPGADGVREVLEATLPPAWLPDRVVALPLLPRLPSGKLDRAALRAHRPEAGATPGRTAVAVPSGSVLQETVLSLVRTLLDDGGIGLDDDFFAVGGNSLVAARLVGHLHAVLGVSVPLHELAASPTVRGIAALADRHPDAGSGTGPEALRLVPVRAGGSLPPAVLVARDGATSLVLQHFLAQVEPRRPVWTLLRPMPPLGLQTPDLVDDGAAVARALLERFPSGPVHLFGHSAAGVVVLEAARGLGHRRGTTVLLDTIPPPTWTTAPQRRLDELARWAVRARRLRRLAASGTAAEGRPAPATARALRTFQDGRATLRARLRPVDFPVVLLTTTEAREAIGRDDLGWGRWAPAVQLVPVDGDHHALLLHPQVARTARHLDGLFSAWER